MKRRVELYGRLRDSGLGNAVSLELPPRATARQALALLKDALGKRGALTTGCAVATQDIILAMDDVLPKNARLAVLPPVCGG